MLSLIRRETTNQDEKLNPWAIEKFAKMPERILIKISNIRVISWEMSRTCLQMAKNREKFKKPLKYFEEWTIYKDKKKCRVFPV